METTQVTWTRTYTAEINGVAYAIRKEVSDMGGALVWTMKGTDGYNTWASSLKLAKQLVEEHAGVRPHQVRLFNA